MTVREAGDNVAHRQDCCAVCRVGDGRFQLLGGAAIGRWRSDNVVCVKDQPAAESSVAVDQLAQLGSIEIRSVQVSRQQIGKVYDPVIDAAADPPAGPEL